MLIVVLGPDGAGKTTLAKGLANALEQGEYRYLGHNTNRHYRVGQHWMASLPNRWFWVRGVRKLLVLWNDWLDHRTTPTELTIADRCSVDWVVGNRLFGRKSWRMYQWLVRWFPKPDLVLLLEGDPELIHRRKPEHPPARLTTLMRLYHHYLLQEKIPFRTIDTTQNNVSEALGIGTKYIHQLITR
ncbi:MAG: hypothetical protein ACFB10_24140 [Salibacteraceae bacterium]